MTNQTSHRPVNRQIDPAILGPAVSARPLALALIVSGICFLSYPALRPFSDETSLAGARAFGSVQWVVAHALGIAAFTLLAIGMLGLYLRFERVAPRRSLWAIVLTILGAGLTLPYYGAEVFGLHAIGQTSLERSDTDLFTTLTDRVRWGPGIWFIVIGLIALAVGAVLAASAVWTSREGPARWSGVPLAIGLLLYLPQFAGPQWMRVAHGALMALGCILLAWSWTGPSRRSEERVHGEG